MDYDSGVASLVELIRERKVPPGVLRSAARGALSLAPAEQIEVLVSLADDPTLGEQARATLSQLEAATAAPVLSATTSHEVVNYFLHPRNRRPELLAPILENPGLPQSTLETMAETASGEVAHALLRSARAMNSPAMLRALAHHPDFSEEEQRIVAVRLAELEGAPLEATVHDFELEQWIADHAAEIAAEEGKAFTLIGGVADEQVEGADVVEKNVAEQLANAAPEQTERLSLLQRLAKMTVGERVKTAMKGGREERLVLIRDGSKIVSTAVLNSPKVTDQEIESFAAMKNVQESVLREISRNRKFMKNYSVVRNLCNNPRMPLDVALGLIKNLQQQDLRGLSMNKNVAETLRKMALKLFKLRSAPNAKAGGE